jgi:hypothetical protein
VLAGAFAAISALPSQAPVTGVLAFGLAGFGCSALLPLTISFGQERLVSMSAVVAGPVIAFYQLGYGIAVHDDTTACFGTDLLGALSSV